MAASADKQEAIAIIGAACRLPGQVSNLGNLWDMISNARTGHCKVPEDRWDADLLYHPDPDRKGTVSDLCSLLCASGKKTASLLTLGL
jgi:acyl transferase domain-containing protein